MEPPPDAAPSEWPKAEKTADALTLTWECGGKVVIPTPFLEAVRQGLGETHQRLSLAINTVLTDWRCGCVKPTRFSSGRPYFLAWVRNTLVTLQEMERSELPQTQPDPDESPERVLH